MYTIFRILCGFVKDSNLLYYAVDGLTGFLSFLGTEAAQTVAANRSGRRNNCGWPRNCHTLALPSGLYR